jgi:hypothetical protein
VIPVLLIALAHLPSDVRECGQAAPAAEPPSTAELAAAVRALDDGLDDGQARAWTGSVREQRPEDESGPVGGVMVLGAGTGDPPFEGAIEVLLSEREELLIASARSLPEVVVYDDGERLLVRTTVEDEPVGAGQLANDLVSLLDLASLAAQVEKAARVEAGPAAADGSRSAEVELSPRSVRAQNRGMLGLLAPKILRVRARFELDARGAIRGLRFAVTRTDPMAGVRRRALDGALAGGGNLAFEGGDLGDEEGATSVYELRASEAEPSARAREALGAMRRICGER